MSATALTYFWQTTGTPLNIRGWRFTRHLWISKVPAGCYCRNK